MSALPVQYVFASGEATTAGEAYQNAEDELQRRLADIGPARVYSIEHQTAVRVLPTSGIDAESLETVMRDYPLVLITLLATVAAPTTGGIGQ